MGRKLPFNSEILELAEHQDSDEAQRLIDAVERGDADVDLIRLAKELLKKCKSMGILTEEDIVELMEPNDDEVDGSAKDEIAEIIDGDDDDGSADFDMVASTAGIPETEVDNEEDEEDN